MATNIINAKLGCPDVTVWADWAWQYDYGQILKLSGVDLPAAYEVHFSNQETGGTTITQIGNEDGVTVPDEFFLTGADIYVWIFLHAGEDDGETIYKVVIPVKDRPRPSNETPTPVQQDAITEAIAALNAGVQRAEAAADEWENMSATAETLPAGSSATASYSEGVLSLGIPKGDTGAQGETGPAGQDGRDGVTPDFSIGTVSTLPAGSSATASITGTTEEPVLNLGIPQGQQGETGATGPTGATPNLTIGTVTTLPAGSDATATITGTAESPVLSLGIPKGDAGEVTESELTAALMNKADVITDTASGSIVSIPDGMASLVLGLDVDIEPIQDLHGYDKPWPAGGMNKLDVSVMKNGYFTSNGGIAPAGGTTKEIYTENYTPIDNTKYYTFSAVVPNSNEKWIGVCIYDSNKNFLRRSADSVGTEHTFSRSLSPSDLSGGAYVRMSFRSYGNYSELQMNEGQSVLPYSNICPISGRSEVSVTRTGKNLLEEDAIASSGSQNGIDYVVNADGSITVSGTATANVTLQVMSKRDLPEGTYTVSGVPANSGGAGLRLWARDNNRYFSSVNGANDKGVLSMQVYSYITIATGTALSSPVTIYPQIELGSTAHSYEPYTAQTITIPLGQTVYGGTVDVTSGKLQFTSVMETYDGSNDENWGLISSGSTRRFRMVKSGYNSLLLSSAFKQISLSSGSWGECSYASSYITLNDGTSQIEDVSALKTWLASNLPQFLYKLATPIEVTLTAEELNILYGDNNVWADSGDTTVEYRADTKLWILKKIAQTLNS